MNLTPNRLLLVCFLTFFFSLFSLPSRGQDPRARYFGLDERLGKGSFFDKHTTGFMLYDLEEQTLQYEKNSHLYFIPASTVKLLTFYGALIVLGDSSNLIRYTTKENEITFWGTGDPSWKYPKLPQPALDSFLKKFESIYFSQSNWKSDAFGFGWQWDDFFYSFSAERSSMPIFGNLVTAEKKGNQPVLSPAYFRNSLQAMDRDVRNVQREFHSNQFYYNPRSYNGMKIEVPFITSPELFVDLAGQALQKKVVLSAERLPEKHQVLKGLPTQILYREMLKESDNFIAEQLLLMVSDVLFKELNPERAIDYIQKTHLFDLPDKPLWVDGSGLSRHNLMTPRSMVTLAEKIYRIVPDQTLFDLLPVGGVDGTLRNSYKSLTPYIHAKTGTLSNNHDLVGFIKTKSNKVYAFAFMNNNYPYKASVVRTEMEKVLLYIRDNF
ncbi:D-alanyl-D-alanine carboxypeptidase/D-alanyl-D-alanine-endopeptidase [Pararhodonellum marinum]|uniref:D-alanyl-D-alanine carboxypeptidase/D-alanyl-D-alanine-endopeptidase n=1 Tax=Pararhodonellum marinum TaxID=2755358 RepID=UPI0018902204|nr:D-alanyl-D-alanine carboxypeptidase [Pararhodonellum marinum]